MNKIIRFIFLGLLMSANSHAEKACCEKESKAELLKADQEVAQMAEEEAKAAQVETPAALPNSPEAKIDSDALKSKQWSEKKKIIITRWLNSLSLSPEQEDAIIAVLSPAQIEKVMQVISD